MIMANDFDAFVESAKENEAHALEIKQTRVGGLGGSDATILLKIGRDGMAALTNTDLKRLAVMVGTIEQDDWGGNAYTKAGHAFEDYAEKVLPFGKHGYEREKMIDAPLARNFKTFAHADFAAGESKMDVVECKFVQKDTQAVASAYAAQLQWYYALGANTVTLYHGTGSVEPFDENTVEGTLLPIERDELTIKALLAGIKTLDEALTGGWTPLPKDKVEVELTPSIVQDAYKRLAYSKELIQTAKDEESAAKGVLLEYMNALGFNGLVDKNRGTQVSMISAKTQSRFDLKAFKGALEQVAQGDAGATFTLGEILEQIERATKTTAVAATIAFK